MATPDVLFSHLKGSYVNRADSHSARPARNGTASGPNARGQGTDAGAEVVTVPVLSLRAGDSPRLNGEDKAHIARLAETETPLPPILVDRRTMHVIDGMHRLMAASLQGRETIDVVFFDGSDADVFLRAVEENVTHGLPLSQADRRAAAERIIESHPNLSDRAIGRAAGLAAKTVVAIRARSSNIPEGTARVGRDGRFRPLDSGEGRRRAAEFLVQQPEASLRDVARVAGISPATVRDVRKRIERGEPPTPEKVSASATVAAAGSDASASRASEVSAPADAVHKLLRDPSLRNNEQGKGMLRLLHVNAVGAEQLPDAAEAVPPHCVTVIVRLAEQYAQMWDEFARELNRRAQIIDPPASAR
jgi:ParB-like chromosome segregation protein Spo0J